MTKYNPVSLIHGSIHDAAGIIVEKPAVLVDAESGTFHGWGELDGMTARMADIAARSGGQLSMTVIDLSAMPKDMACYVILRMLRYTASGFIQEFMKRGSDPDAMRWLRYEVTRVPIQIPEALEA